LGYCDALLSASRMSSRPVKNVRLWMGFCDKTRLPRKRGKAPPPVEMLVQRGEQERDVGDDGLKR